MVDLGIHRGRILVFAVGAGNSGIPRTPGQPPRLRPASTCCAALSDGTADELLDRARGCKRHGDIALVSIHGVDWGYEVPDAHVRFAHRLIDGDVDLIHGHSSHHPRPIEIYRNKLVLYGCGDFITDYEGITGHEPFRDDLVVMYFPDLDPATGRARRPVI